MNQTHTHAVMQQHPTADVTGMQLADAKLGRTFEDMQDHRLGHGAVNKGKQNSRTRQMFAESGSCKHLLCVSENLLCASEKTETARQTEKEIQKKKERERERKKERKSDRQPDR